MCKSMGDESTRPSVPLSVFHTAAGGTRIYRGRKLVFVKFKPSQEVAYARGDEQTDNNNNKSFQPKIYFHMFLLLFFSLFPPLFSSFFFFLLSIAMPRKLMRANKQFSFCRPYVRPLYGSQRKRGRFFVPFLRHVLNQHERSIYVPATISHSRWRKLTEKNEGA